MSPSYKQMAERRKVLGDELLYAMRGRAACKGESAWWTSCENDFETAQTVAVARAASAGAVEMCSRCPVVDLCELWAFSGKYSGLAAGHAWVDGRKRNPQLLVDDPKGWMRSWAAQLAWADLKQLVQQLTSGGEVDAN